MIPKSDCRSIKTRPFTKFSAPLVANDVTHEKCIEIHKARVNRVEGMEKELRKGSENKVKIRVMRE